MNDQPGSPHRDAGQNGSSWQPECAPLSTAWGVESVSSCRVYVILTCRNRKRLTVRAITQLRNSAELANVDCEFFVLDDGSDDGTADAVASMPSVHVLRGNGSFYWAGGMAESERAALARSAEDQSDYILWVNDDVDFDENAVGRMIDAATRFTSCIVVGSCKDPNSGDTTYGGYKRYDMHPLHLRRVEPSAGFVDLDTMNGNAVLVPSSVALEMGGIDGRFSHSWADIDYGLRARREGRRIILVPGYIGSCARNTTRRLPFVEELRRFLGPKGAGHVRSLHRILSRHSPLAWPVYFAATYLLWIVRHAGRRI